MAEPLSLVQAKAQLRILDNDEDQAITDAIVDARGWVEEYTGMILTRREVVEIVDGFGDKLRAWPIASISGIAYFDAAGVETIMPSTDYFAQISQRPARLSAPSWPAVMRGSKVEVTMLAGFATADAVAAFSPNLMRAMRLLVAGFYNDRETGGLAGDVDVAARRLCRGFRRWAV